MHSLTHQRCFNHATREAAARCPECQRFFCRECITEHDDRVVCSDCLKKLARVPLAQRSGFVGLMRLCQCGAAIVIAWFFFFLVAEALLRLPSSFHEGTLWVAPWLEQE